VTAALAQGLSVVVDATHATLDSREGLYQRAELNDATVVIAWIIRDGRSFNRCREETKVVPRVAYQRYQKSFQDPQADGRGAKIVVLF